MPHEPVPITVTRAVRMITFTSTTCTDGYIKAFDLVGPETDGDTNWRVTLQ